jgi:hypothetical protein
MPDRNDELIAIRNHVNQKAAEAAINQIAKEAEANASNELAAAGRFDDAAYHLREAWRLDEEARKIAVGAQQAQQQQSGLTPGEQAWIEANPHVWNDTEKRTEAIKAANSLVLRGYRRGSPEYLAAIEHWVGLVDANGQDSLPVINDSEVARISRSKYGETSPEEIALGRQRVAELKRYGFYPMDPNS